jgi:hypothetical protein
LPGANTQGEMLEELRENLSEAIQFILEANREQFERQIAPDSKVMCEQLFFAQLSSDETSRSRPAHRILWMCFPTRGLLRSTA